MTERYNAIEVELGIKAYTTSPEENQGFAAVLKARYSDFLVHEVDEDGNMAVLDTLSYRPVEKEEIPKDEGTPEENDAKKIKIEGENADSNTSTKIVIDTAATVKVDARILELDTAQAELGKVVSEDVARAAVDMLKHWLDKSKRIAKNDEPDTDTNYVFPLIEQKETRTKIHLLIKGDLLKKYAVADTIDQKIRLWPKQFKKDNRDNRKRKRKESEWPADRPDYLKFVLYKENMDTNAAIRDMNRFSNVRHKERIEVAGMKDKRGVTSQFCTVYRQEPKDLQCLNRSKPFNSFLRVGNFSYTDEQLRLGKLRGNRFDIVLRNMDIGPSEKGNDLKSATKKLESAANAFKNKGFINYFGMQRFGRHQDTHKVGLCVLTNKFEDAINMIMSEKDYGQDNFCNSKRLWKKRFEGIADDDEEGKKLAEGKIAKSAIRDLGRFMMCETSLMNSLSRRPRDYKAAFRCIVKNTQLMFLHAVQSWFWNKVASHRIETGGSVNPMVGDLVLVGNKALSEGGSGTSGLKGKTVKLLTDEDVAGGKYSITDVVLPLPGSKVEYPTNSSGELYKTLLVEQGLDDTTWVQSNRELSLGGDYRHLICKPSDVSYEIKTYIDPKAPLMKTDFMNVEGIALVDAEDDKKRLEKESGSPPDPAETVVAEKDVSEKTETEPILLGMVIGFTLPPSSYATIALRELMKRPTSIDYQSKLALDGRCERALTTTDTGKPDNGTTNN